MIKIPMYVGSKPDYMLHLRESRSPSFYAIEEHEHNTTNPHHDHDHDQHNHNHNHPSQFLFLILIQTLILILIDMAHGLVDFHRAFN